MAKVQRALNDMGRSVKGSRIGVFGVSYKPGVGDVRESPALKIIELLASQGAQVSYHDQHVPSLHDLGLNSVPFDDALTDTDLAIILTAHPGVDHELIASRAPAVLDLRGVLRHSRVAGVTRL
jgi:UDP-N-acetyl-D-glucosamine dehydrogenase